MYWQSFSIRSAGAVEMKINILSARGISGIKSYMYSKSLMELKPMTFCRPVEPSDHLGTGRLEANYAIN